MLADFILVAELSLLQDSRIACGFETGNMQLGNKKLSFAFKLSIALVGLNAFSSGD